MFKRNNLMATVCMFSMAAGSPSFSNDETQGFLTGIFASLEDEGLIVDIGDEDDGLRHTQWNNVTIKTEDGTAQVAIPWLRLDKKLLGGFELTYAEKINGVFQSPDPKIVEPIKYIVESIGSSVDLDFIDNGFAMQTQYDDIIFRTLDNDVINLMLKMSDGDADYSFTYNGQLDGSFTVPKMEIGYDMNVEGQSVIYSSSVNDFSGSLNIPEYEFTDDKEPTIIFDASRDAGFDYSVGSGTTAITASTEVGPVELNGTFSGGTGFFGIKDSFAKLLGTTNEIDYTINVSAMGLPPMQVTTDQAIANFSIPLDNIEDAKQADLKFAISELSLSDQIWAMVDPTALMPRENINLDIDIQSSMLWLSKIADFDFKTNQPPPVTFEDAKITALNLNIAGAEMVTSGQVNIDNTQFPPVPDGTVDITLKGAKGLLNNLAQVGLIPMQTAMMVQGMSGMFFKQGDGGEDHLISKIEMTKDGKITANGMPLK